jgi:hypothetical protein
MSLHDSDGGTSDAAWPADLRGVTESIVTTLGPNDRWNVAALGLFAGDPVTARTWGRTRTWRNFTERGGGYVQFSTDPVDFVDAACSIREEDEPVLESADAWAKVDAESVDRGTEGDTQWVDWELTPVESAIERETVPTTNRGYYAVVEATVAASRLDVPGRVLRGRRRAMWRPPRAGRLRAVSRTHGARRLTGGGSATHAMCLSTTRPGS